MNKKISSILAAGAIMITVSPVAGTVIEIGNNVVHAESYKAGDSGTRTLNFNIKPNEKTDTKTEVIGEPLDLIMIIDGSGSTIEPFNSGDNPNRRKVNVSLGDALKLAESLPEGSQVMIASYTTNKKDSYDKRGVTRLIPKAEAVKILNEIKDSAPASIYEFEWYKVWEKYLNGLNDKLFDKNRKDIPFEEAYEKETTKKNKYVSVVQFTDEWIQDEDIDSSFATWSKANAKTFMSVLYPKTNDVSRSETMMKAVGHPNIYNARGKTDEQRQKDIIEKFKATALKINTVTTKTFPIGEITIRAEEGISITEAYLISPKGEKTKLLLNNKASWSTISWAGKLEEEGEYKVVYKFSGSPTETKKIFGNVDVSNKSVVNAVDTIDPNKSTSDEVTEEDIPFETIEEKDPNLPLGERKIKVKGELGKKRTTKTFNLINGVRSGDPTVDTKIVKEKVDEVVLVGTKVKQADVKKKPIETGATSSTIAMPLIGLLSGASVIGLAGYIAKRKR